MNRKLSLKNLGNVLVTAIVCVIVSFGICFSQGSTVTINVNGATTTMPQGMFGTLMERLGRQWGNTGVLAGTSSTIPNTNGMRNDVIEAFKECGVGAIQWPGGCAAWDYPWKTSTNPSNDVGTDRFLQFCKLTGAEPVICGPAYTNSAASNLAWLKYIDSATAKLGMDSLRWFKIGNEVWGGCGSGKSFTVSAYCTNYSTIYNALKGYRSSIKIEACNEAEHNNVPAWMQTLFQTLGNKFDGLEYHDYIYHPDPNGFSSSDFTAAQYWQLMYEACAGDFADHLKNKIIPTFNSLDPNKRVKLIVDEWGNWLEDVGDEWEQYISVMDALSAAQHLHLQMSYCDRIEVSCLAQGINVIHSLLNIDKTSKVMVKTPVFYVYKMLKYHHSNGAKWAPISASNIQTITQSTTSGDKTMPVLTVGSTVDDSGFVNISVSNIDLTTSRQLTITLNSSASYSAADAWIVTGTDIKSTNPYGGPENVNIKTLPASNYNFSNLGNALSATIPSKSVVMFRLKPPVSVHKAHYKDPADAFSVKVRGRNTLVINSSVNKKTPIEISLYGIDGKKCIERFSGSLEPGQKNIVWQIENRIIGSNVYIMKVKAGNTVQSKQIFF